MQKSQKIVVRCFAAAFRDNVKFMQTAADTLERTDKALLHAFMRLCHFVDWHFHINQFDLARDVMGAGLAQFGAQSCRMC